MTELTELTPAQAPALTANREFCTWLQCSIAMHVCCQVQIPDMNKDLIWRLNIEGMMPKGIIMYWISYELAAADYGLKP